MVRMPHWPKNINYRNIDFRLERIYITLEKLGNPHLQIPPVIHIAGTNGKGSTSAFMSTILKCAGYKVHRYTSPHIVRFNERIQINSQDISDKYLFEVLEKTRIIQEQLDFRLTFFEATTVAAFIAYAENPADYLVVETGMGGRLDATNVIENKIASIITPISYDHMDYLGDSLAKIAREKAGIMRPNVPTIVTIQTEEALNSLVDFAEKNNCQLIIQDYEYGLEQNSDNSINFVNEFTRFKMTQPSLTGDHQYINAAAAIETALIIKPQLDINIINNAISNTYWPARMQLITRGPLRKLVPDNWNVYVDGAHNISGGQILGVWAHDQDPEIPLYIICGMTKNRDVKGFLTYLGPKITYLIGVYVEDEAASYHGHHITEQVKEMGIKCDDCEYLDDAMQRLREFHGENSKSANVIICGSLYLAGMFLRQNGDLVEN